MKLLGWMAIAGLLLAQSPAPVPCQQVVGLMPGAIFLPQVYMNVDQTGVLHFVCNNLFAIPQFQQTPCPAPIPLPAIAPGLQIYFGLGSSGVLHVGLPNQSVTLTCNCAQDMTQSGAPGEWPIGVWTSGFGITPQWGAPAMPMVTVLGCDTNGYSVAQSAGSVTVTCN